jgi:hypothetical protein
MLSTPSEVVLEVDIPRLTEADTKYEVRRFRHKVLRNEKGIALRTVAPWSLYGPVDFPSVDEPSVIALGPLFLHYRLRSLRLTM